MVVNQYLYYSLMLQMHSVKWRYNKLQDHSMCPHSTKLLHYMYTNQSCCVKWGTEHSGNFNASNDVNQGGVISLFLFSCYIDKLLSLLQNSGLDGHVGTSYAGSLRYADDIALVVPSMQCLKKMILLHVCESYANSHSITFNPNKSKLLYYNVDETGVLPPIYLNGEMIPMVYSGKYIGTYISTNIADIYI